jgi:hypothetical protein
MNPVLPKCGRVFPALGLLLLVVLPVAAGAQASGDASRQRQLDEYLEQERQRRIEETRTSFLSRVDGIPVGSTDRARRQEFRSDLRLFRRRIVEFWALRFAPMSEAWARRDLTERTEELAGLLERMREHVNRDSSPPDAEPVPLAGRTFSEHLDRFFLVASRLPARAVAVTEGQVLDFGLLLEVREDFRTLESWTSALGESARR